PYCASCPLHSFPTRRSSDLSLLPCPRPLLVFAIRCVLSEYGGSVITASTFGSVGSISRQSPRYSTALPISTRSKLMLLPSRSCASRTLTWPRPPCRRRR